MYRTILDQYGAPKNYFFGTPDTLDLNTPDGATYVNEAPQGDWYESGQWHNKPPQPELYMVWNWETKAWEDQRTPEDLEEEFEDYKLKTWERIKAIRTGIEFGTFEYNGMIFDGDISAQRRLGVYISQAKSDPTLVRQFFLADNSVATLTAADFIQIEQVKSEQVAEAFAIAGVLREQIALATTKEQLDNIQWPEGV